MFKDLYKNANDKIPTEDAYLRVMESVNTKSKKTKYSYAKIVALAACFLLTVSMVSVYENFAPKEETPVVITPENLPAKVPVVQEVTPTPEVQPKVTKVLETEAPAPIEEIQPEPTLNPEVTETSEVTEVTEPVQTVEPAEVIVTPKVISEPVITQEPIIAQEPENAFVKNQGIPENLGLAAARFTLGDTVTKDTYYEYLGLNVEESIVLPDGFTNETPDVHMLCLEQNENFDDRWTFYFTQGDNSIFITTTKNTEKVSGFLNDENYEKSNVSGTKAVLFEQDLEKIACIEADGISYTLSSYGVSDEDFENLIISIVK